MKILYISLLSVFVLSSCMEYENGIDEYDTTPSDPIFNPSGTKRLKTFSNNTIIDTEIDIPTLGMVSIDSEIQTLTEYSSDLTLIETSITTTNIIDVLGQVQEATSTSINTQNLEDLKIIDSNFATTVEDQTTTASKTVTWNNDFPSNIQFSTTDISATGYTSQLVSAGDLVNVTKTDDTSQVTLLEYEISDQKINQITVTSDDFNYDILINLNYVGENLSSTTISTTDNAFNDTYTYTYDNNINPANVYNDEQSNIRLGNILINLSELGFESIENQFSTNALEGIVRYIATIAPNNLIRISNDNDDILNTSLTYDTDSHPVTGNQTSQSIQQNYIELPGIFELEPIEANSTLEYTYYD